MPLLSDHADYSHTICRRWFVSQTVCLLLEYATMAWQYRGPLLILTDNSFRLIAYENLTLFQKRFTGRSIFQSLCTGTKSRKRPFVASLYKVDDSCITCSEFKFNFRSAALLSAHIRWKIVRYRCPAIHWNRDLSKSPNYFCWNVPVASWYILLYSHSRRRLKVMFSCQFSILLVKFTTSISSVQVHKSNFYYNSPRSI